MKNVLVPIGTSPDNHNTLQYALDFAAEFSAQVFLMEVFTASIGAGRNLKNTEGAITGSSKERMKEMIDKVEVKGSNVKIATYKGDLIDGLKEIDRELGIDLIIIAARSNDIAEELFLGHTSGRIIKRTDIPTLIVPRGTSLRPLKTILTAFKSGVLKQERILNPLVAVKQKFDAKVNLLLVKTPGYTKDDLKVNTALMDISSQMTVTEAPTTYFGVLEHFQTQQPDLLCVFRRKRGFFKKLWEKNTIPKAEFASKTPVLVLSVKKD